MNWLDILTVIGFWLGLAFAAAALILTEYEEFVVVTDRMEEEVLESLVNRIWRTYAVYLSFSCLLLILKIL